jgi:hypothetical protein
VPSWPVAQFAVLEKGIYYIDRAGRESRLQYFDFATNKSVSSLVTSATFAPTSPPLQTVARF